MSEEDGGDKCYTALEFEYLIEVVLFHEDGVMRTFLIAAAAVDAEVLEDVGLAFAHSDGFGGTDTDAVSAALTHVLVDM